MRFQFIPGNDGTVAVQFVSSKEIVPMGTLVFIDGDGDERDDIRDLLVTTLRIVDNPLLELAI
jgi:hypothetical protein